jgi:hypothetical protein
MKTKATMQTEERRPSVLLAVLAYTGDVTVETAIALCACRDLVREVVWVVGDCSIPSARNLAAARFLAGPDDLLVFVDADISFAREQLVQLIALASRGGGERAARVVGGLYATRMGNRVNWLPLPGENWTRDLVRVEWVGGGFLAIPRAALLQIQLAGRGRRYLQDGEERVDYFPAGATVHGEWLSDDVAFCRLCRNAAVTVYAAPQVTVSHRAHRWLDLDQVQAGPVVRTPGRPRQYPRLRLQRRKGGV